MSPNQHPPAPQPQAARRIAYLFGADREASTPSRAGFSAGGAGAVAC